MVQSSAYRRIILKLSGEALMGKEKFGVDKQACDTIAHSIAELHAMGIEIGLVIGGGNIFRGAQAAEFGFDRTPADHIGMLATTINGLVLSQSLKALGIKTKVLSSLGDAVVEKYVWSQAQHYLQQGILVIFVGGTGNPFFTTDTAAALRASEMGAELLVKATKVSGVYSADPTIDPRATRYTTLSYTEALTKQLHVMDATALALCRENAIPIYVCNLFEPGSLQRAVCHLDGGTLVEGD